MNLPPHPRPGPGDCAALPSTPPAVRRGRSSALAAAVKITGAVLWLAAGSVRAQAQSTPDAGLSNLTLGNFFSEGWDQNWAKRPNPDGAPDMALLRVQTNFLEREFRTDFYTQQDLNSPKNRTIDFGDALIAYGLNRRFMVSVTTNYQATNSRVNNDADASSGALGLRMQLVDIPGSSYAFNVKVTTPAKSLGNDLTTVNYNVAGWEDLTPYGLPKFGLYFSAGFDNFVGPHPIGTKSSDAAYDVSLAKTWTEPTATLGNFTTFAELFGTTDTSGSTSGKTVVTLTPGIRTGIGHNQILMAGVDLPVSHPRPYNEGLRITYIINF